MSEWISVEERLPGFGAVLVFDGNRIIRLAQLAAHRPNLRKNDQDDFDKWASVPGAWPVSGVTHWMPLPASPPATEKDHP